ncbi:MarR family winged helix-turn-helix transcriptional regulator [Williamsia sp. SKLECPSW1]
MTEDPPPLPLLLARASRAVDHRMAAIVADIGVSTDQWRVLLVLSRSDGITMSDLADAAVLSAAGATRAVDALVSRAMVYRRADPTDRRRIVVFLSAHGVVTVEPGIHAMEQMERDIAATIGSRRHLALGDGLLHLIDHEILMGVVGETSV